MSKYHKAHRVKGRRWAKLRRQCLHRDGYQCVQCKAQGVQLHADHVKPLVQGGEAWDLANLQTLCTTCHAAKTGRERHPRESTAWDLLADAALELEHGDLQSDHQHRGTGRVVG